MPPKAAPPQQADVRGPACPRPSSLSNHWRMIVTPKNSRPCNCMTHTAHQDATSLSAHPTDQLQCQLYRNHSGPTISQLQLINRHMQIPHSCMLDKPARTRSPCHTCPPQLQQTNSLSPCKQTSCMLRQAWHTRPLCASSPRHTHMSVAVGQQFLQ
jgi:hypothetical protein